MEKNEFIEYFRNRTKEYATRAIRVYRSLPKTGDAKVVSNQFLRAATSVAANYRAACRARSKAEFFAKLSITIEEADECLLWLEIMRDSEMFLPEKLSDIMQETLEIISVLAKARKNTN